MIKYGGRVNIPWTIFGNNILYVRGVSGVSGARSSRLESPHSSVEHFCCWGWRASW